MKYCLLLFFTFFLNLSFGQTETDVYKKINDVYGKNYAEQLAITNPGKLQVLKKYASTGFIVLNGNVSAKDVITINEIPLREKGVTMSIENFVFLLLNETYNPLVFEWTPDMLPRVYRLNSTDYYICIPSQKQLERI
jgi:hypothetical protein